MRHRLRLSYLVFALLLLVIVPTVSAQQQTYTVQPGDTLARIGRINNLDVDCLAERNNIANPNRIDQGDVIILDFTCPPYDDDRFGTGAAMTNSRTYIVQQGDGLNQIARTFDVDLACTIARNGIVNANLIVPGQVLTIDFTCPAYSGFTGQGQVQTSNVQAPAGSVTYTVQRGDFLTRIGRALNVSPTCIATTNNLINPSRIFPGQQLVISASCPPFAG